MTETQTPNKPYGPKTDPADLLTLFGRFFSSVLLMLLTILMLLRHNYAVAALASLVAVLTQRATINLYRRLRDERVVALEALRVQGEEQSHAA
ncbi:MAG: hypothetical protein V4671_21580 [Armatimonadota bacterium]